MRVIFGCGGTGGHLYPALALASYIKQQEPDSEFLFVGTTNRLESIVVPQRGIAYKGLDLQGFVGNPINKLKCALKFVWSIGKSTKIVKDFNPDVVIGFGGYPSSAIVYGASLKKVPTVIHEQNSIIGLANKILINRVDSIVACYDKAMEGFPSEKSYLLGNPRATEVLQGEIHDVSEKYNLDKNKKTVLIVMGSLGSASVNKVIKEAMPDLKTKDYQVVFVTGNNDYDHMKEELKNLPSNVSLVKYVDDMPSLLSTVDLVVTRAGASTLAEVTSLGVASIIIPSPYVAANHQEYNARSLYDVNAAEMILEKDLNKDILLTKIDELFNDENKYQTIKANAKKLGKPNACQDIYQLMKETINKK